MLLLHLIPFTVQQKRQSVWEMCKIQPHELDCESSLWTIPEIKGGDPRTDLGRPRDHFGETPGAVWAVPSGNVPKTRFSGRRPWRPFSGPVAPRNPRISADPGTSLRLFKPIRENRPGAGKPKSARSGKTNANFPIFLVLFVPARSRYHFRVQRAALSANPVTTLPGDEFSVSRDRFAQFP